jgi:hypothetical protein
MIGKRTLARQGARGPRSDGLEYIVGETKTSRLTSARGCVSLAAHTAPATAVIGRSARSTRKRPAYDRAFGDQFPANPARAAGFAISSSSCLRAEDVRALSGVAVAVGPVAAAVLLTPIPAPTPSIVWPSRSSVTRDAPMTTPSAGQLLRSRESLVSVVITSPHCT